MTAAATSSGLGEAQRRLGIRLNRMTSRNVATTTGDRDPVLRWARDSMLRALAKKDRLVVGLERARSHTELIDVAEKIAGCDAEIAAQVVAIEARGGWV